MPQATIRGVEINYEMLGERGPWVALQPGGRRGLEAVKPLGQKLAEAGHRVLVDAAPAFIGGSSSGCRLALLAALRRPADVRGLLLWRVTGGTFAAQRLVHNYYTQFIEAAERGGME